MPHVSLYVAPAQLKKLNTKFPVPLIVANYGGFYDGLMGLLKVGGVGREPVGTAQGAQC